MTDLNHIQETLVRLASKSSWAVAEYFDLCKPFFLEAPRIDPKQQFVLTQLAASCHWTSESTLLLIANVRLWDAEILIRSVLEGTYKYIFLCTGDDGELATKVRIRQQLERKWSFSEIAQTLSKPEGGFGGLDVFTGMMLGYGISGHLLHQDADAVSIIWERNEREEERKEAIELAHGAREISDVLTMAMLRALVTFRLHGENTVPVRNLSDSQAAFLDEIHTYARKWHDLEYRKGEE